MSPFSSKYDYYLQGLVQLTPQEQQGLTLFNGKGNCGSCHTSKPGPKGEPPLFTDFTYANLGIPKNPENPYYRMDRVNVDGKPINPEGANWVDLGLADFLRTSDDPAWRDKAPESRGKHRVPTLRNVDKRPSPDFPKAYMHNGVFKSLEDVVHFYNTRDVPGGKLAGSRSAPECEHGRGRQPRTDAAGGSGHCRISQNPLRWLHPLTATTPDRIRAIGRPFRGSVCCLFHMPCTNPWRTLYIGREVLYTERSPVAGASACVCIG